MQASVKLPNNKRSVVSKSKGKLPSYIIGIDEAGRGPLAGPLSICAFTVSREYSKIVLKRAGDSKQISEKNREEIFNEVVTFKKQKKCFFEVTLVSAKIIDKKGISYAIRAGLKKSLEKVVKQINKKPAEVLVLMDGSLKAPEEYINQNTIIRGDSLVPVIGMASIMAKVTRDKHMRRLSKKYPKYGFEIHKGYGTKAHYGAIRRYGISEIHRKTWIKTVN